MNRGFKEVNFMLLQYYPKHKIKHALFSLAVLWAPVLGSQRDDSRCS
jgi:hypothetical protein